MAHLLRQTFVPKPSSSFPTRFLNPTRNLCTSTPTTTAVSQSFLRSYRLALGLSIPALALVVVQSSQKKVVDCAATDRPYATNTTVNVVPAQREPTPLPPAESILNWTELSFGTVSGICVGVFVKKGLKAIAFALGGVFVLMQYFSSRSFITINWKALTTSYDSFITRNAGPSGTNRAVGLWSSFIDFITADVQGRATFVAGILLGLRIG
ncbi:hypothetical protein T439DRAFT_285038 [Meredithblackwellia eburnea MCA 4105]